MRTKNIFERARALSAQLGVIILLALLATTQQAWGDCTLYGGVDGNEVIAVISSSTALAGQYGSHNSPVTGWEQTNTWTTTKYSFSGTIPASNPSYTKVYDGQTPGANTALYAVYYASCNGNKYSGAPYESYYLDLTPTSGSSYAAANHYCLIKPGTSVTITAYPEAGKSVTAWTVIDGNLDDITPTSTTATTFTFNMPSSDVAAEVVFECPDLSGETLTVTASSITSTGVELSWSIDGADKYDLVLKKGASFDGGTLVSSGSNKTYTSQTISSALDPNTHYWFKVTAMNNCGATTKSRTIDFWTLQRYTISYNGNGGTVSPTSVYADHGSDVVLPLASAGTRTGYDLTKWRLNNASSGTQYNLGGSYTNVTANATFYAQWTPKNYTITYNNLNGATNSNPTSYTIESANITLVAPGSRTGYTFGGWFTNADLAVGHEAGTPAIATGSTGNKVFYAKWTANEIAITLDKNGGVADGAATVNYDGTSATITTAVSHATKTLKGYYTATSDGTKVLEADGSFAATSIDGYITGGKWIKADATTLHAQWLSIERTVTFNLDGKGDNFTRKVENGTPVSKPTPDPTNVDYNFVNWVTTDGGSTPFDFSGNITADVTIYSKWTAKTYQKRVFACVDISVDLEEVDEVKQKVLVTSRNGMNIMAVNKLLVTVDGALAGHTVSITSSDGLKFYKLSGGKYVELTGAANVLRAPLTNETVYVSYNPTSGGTGAITNPTFTIACDGESQEFNTGGEYVRARNLPDAVAIVASVGGSWQGLSANITSSSTPLAKMIAVGTEAGILKAYGAADDFGYKLWQVKTANSAYDRWGDASGYTPAKLYGDRLRFAGKNNQGLVANDNAKTNLYNINNSGAIATVNTSFANEENYEWKVTTREVDGQFIYTLQTDQTNNKRYLQLWSGRWGTYNDGKGTNDLYILPLVETAQVDMAQYEWGTNKVVVRYTPAATPVALTSISVDGETVGGATFTRIGSSDLWKAENLGTLTDKPAKQLLIRLTENSSPKQGLIQIPLLVNGNSTEAELRASLTGTNAAEKNKVAKNTDVVILKGGKMTTGTASGNFKDLYIYPGGKAVITNAMSFGDIYMRGGLSYLNSGWDVPRAKIDAAVTLAEGGKLYYDMTMDDTKYYDLAVPYEVDLTATTDDMGDGDFNVWLKAYSGAQRAETGKGWVWYDWSGDLKLHPGTGYLIEAEPRYNRTYCTVRFPMSPDLSAGEQAKSAISVTAPGMSAGAIESGKTANNVGWNFLANPYMCNFGLSSITEDPSGTLVSGELVEHINPETGIWDGSYEWDATGDKNVRYVTTFDYNSQEYSQKTLASTTLAPFTGFFIQAAKAGAVNFATAGRQLSAPARMLANNLPEDMEIVLTATGNGQTDEALLHINDELALANDLEFPDEMTKQMNAGKLNFYTLANATGMYANGLSYADAQEWVPAGVTVPADGIYSFSAEDVNSMYIKNVLLLDKTSGFEYDLMNMSPELELTAGTSQERFAVKIVLREQSEVPTGIDGVETDSDGAQKFIWNDKVFILHHGVIYDSTGKRVSVINK